jgi:peptidoglycan/LPS O-acetylase OafA/YrhL
MKKKPTNTAASVRAKLLNCRIKLFEEDNSEEKETHNYSNVHRMIELDILRGIAILLVLGRHVLDIPETLSPVVRHAFLIWREVGWIGVDLFFVLSGFLVSGLLFNEYRETGRLRVGLFLIRRGFKIYPSFYVLLLVCIFTTHLYSFPVAFSRTAFLGEGLFLQNYIGAFWNHTWSLAVEEHFYLILSIIMIVLVNLRSNTKEPFNFIPKLVLTLAILILFLRVLISQFQPIGAWGFTLGYTHLRVDSLFFGLLISYYYVFKRGILFARTRRWLWLCLASIYLTFLLPILFPLDHSRFMYSFGFSLLYLGFGCLLLLCLHPACKCNIKVIRKFSWLAYLGRNSYSIYLWHMFSYNLAARIWSPADSSPKLFFLRTMVYLIGSLLMGILATRAIEFPILRLRDRYFPSKDRTIDRIFVSS